MGVEAHESTKGTSKLERMRKILLGDMVQDNLHHELPPAAGPSVVLAVKARRKLPHSA
jgi:hypothetical protein